jgi:hypothetical protein
MSNFSTEQLVMWVKHWAFGEEFARHPGAQDKVANKIIDRLVEPDALKADVCSALGAHENEGPRLAAMRVRSERDDWHRLCDEQTALLRQAQSALADERGASASLGREIDRLKAALAVGQLP